MPTVDENRLKGNYAAAYVAMRLSAECLVRPVAADTDVGVDLYCETVVDGRPFLHFWVQVKAGKQCRLSGNSAWCSFQVDHLQYWSRQPVPVFAALVPVDWPVRTEPNVYLVDITSQLLDGVQDRVGVNSATLESNHVLRAGHAQDVQRFLLEWVPASAARLQCRNGIVASLPTPVQGYVTTSPLIPVVKFKKSILDQIRRTAALSIIFLNKLGQMGSPNTDFRKTLASVVAIFGDDPHWENFMARGLSFHADNKFSEAVCFYEKAIGSIQGDRKVARLKLWKKLVKEIEGLKRKAKRGEALPKPWESLRLRRRGMTA